jgi:WD repeat-containing protein 76
VSATPKPTPKPKAKPVQPIKREKKILNDYIPRRVSARLRRTDPDETLAQKRKREVRFSDGHRIFFFWLIRIDGRLPPLLFFAFVQQDEEAQRRKEEEERLATEERAREAKKPRHGELDLETLAGQEEWEPGALSGLSSRLQSLLQARHPRRTSERDAFVFKRDSNEEAEVEALRERLRGLKIVARAKVTQDRVYSAAYHPDPTMDLIFFGGACVRCTNFPFFFFSMILWGMDGWLMMLTCEDKHGQLGIWDARAPQDDAENEDQGVDPDQRESGKYWRLQVHWPATSQSSISCIKFDPIDAHSVSHKQSSSSLILTFVAFHRRYTRVRMIRQFAHYPSPPVYRARCSQWTKYLLQVWTFPPRATSCGSQMPKDGSRISICDRTIRNEELISSRIRRSGP